MDKYYWGVLHNKFCDRQWIFCFQDSVRLRTLTKILLVEVVVLLFDHILTCASEQLSQKQTDRKKMFQNYLRCPVATSKSLKGVTYM